MEKIIWVIAHNLLKNYWRDNGRHPTVSLDDELDPRDQRRVFEAYEEFADAVHEEAERQWKMEGAVQLGLWLPEQEDRLLVLFTLTGFTPLQIACLMPVFSSRRTVERHLKLFKSGAPHMISWLEKPDNTRVSLPVSWKEQLSFIGERKPFGITYSNVIPDNIAPDVQQSLCKELGLKSFGQLTNWFIPTLILHQVRTVRPELRFYLIPRADLGWGVLDGNPIYYHEFVLYFEMEGRGNKAHRRPQLYLTDWKFYAARFIRRYKDESGWTGMEWRYEHPDGDLAIFKAFNPDVYIFYEHPNTNIQSLLMFFSSPIKKGFHPLVN